MAETCVISQKEENGIPILAIAGYFTEEVGIELRDAARALINAGKKNLVLDFSDCSVINSLGIAAAMDLSFEILDEHQGQIAFSGINNVVRMALTIAGLLPIVPEYPSSSKAVAALLED